MIAQPPRRELFRSVWPRNKRIRKPMPRDTLFILPMSFVSEGQNQFCPECSELWGLIGWFPDLKATLEIVHVGIDHPRPAISALLGEGRHNAPTLVLHAGSERARGLGYAEANGHAYLASARLIARHFAAIHGTPIPRGE
jgi:hypothetical protein